MERSEVWRFEHHHHVEHRARISPPSESDASSCKALGCVLRADGRTASRVRHGRARNMMRITDRGCRLLLQEVKRACYPAGRLPAARCAVSNTASRATVARAGFRISGYLQRGLIKAGSAWPAIDS